MLRKERKVKRSPLLRLFLLLILFLVTGAFSTTASASASDAVTVESEEPPMDERTAENKATGTGIDSHLDLFLRAVAPLLCH